MTGAGLSPDGKWVWNGTEWVPNTQTGDVEVSDSVISGNVIANQSVNSVDSEVVKAAMTGVVEALKELQPITQQTEPKSDTESTRLKELEMEKYLLEEKKRLKGTELSGKRLGLIGFGRIAQGVATVALAMGMECHAFDPYLLPNIAKKFDCTMHEDVDSLFRLCTHILVADGTANTKIEAEAHLVNIQRQTRRD